MVKKNNSDMEWRILDEAKPRTKTQKLALLREKGLPSADETFELNPIDILLGNLNVSEAQTPLG
jgi:hypothetical protein